MERHIQNICISYVFMKLFTNLKSRESNRMNMPDVFYSLDIFCLVLVICWVVCGVEYGVVYIVVYRVEYGVVYRVVCGVMYAICGLLQNVQSHYDFSQVMRLPRLALNLLYVEAVSTPCSG